VSEESYSYPHHGHVARTDYRTVRCVRRRGRASRHIRRPRRTHGGGRVHHGSTGRV